MKELSIEEKAKAYDEAIERAKAYHNDYTKDIMEDIFPELKESEDERIRKYLIDRIISAYGENSSTPEGIEVKDIIDWLEKQKRCYSDYEESELRRGLLWHLKELQNIEESKGLPIKAKATYDDWIAWLEKQGEKSILFTFDDVLALQCCMETVKKVQEDKELYNELLLLHNKVYDAYTITKDKL